MAKNEIKMEWNIGISQNNEGNVEEQRLHGAKKEWKNRAQSRRMDENGAQVWYTGRRTP